MRLRRTIALTAGTLALAAGGSSRDDGIAASSAPCPPLRLDHAYETSVEQALRSREDVWGNALLAADDGPTYAAAASYLKPLFLARAARGRSLTRSGAHYLAFSGPAGPRGGDVFALHVADGSQILSQAHPRRSLTISVGRKGDERYGACLSRLDTPSLADGYLPILQTRYVDAAGVRYRQESYSTRIPETSALVSFVSITADARGSGPATIRFAPSQRNLVRHGSALVGRGTTELAFSPGPAIGRSSIAYAIPAGERRTVYVAWLSVPARVRRFSPGGSTYARARSSLVGFWRRYVRRGATFNVPEPRVENACHALLAQNLALTWRYSVGNQYEEFSYPEGIDAAEVMADQGFRDVARSMLVTSLGTLSDRYPNWKKGQRLVGSALYYRLYHDRAYVELATPVLARYVADLGRQIRSSPRGLLQPERYSSDIPDVVYGLHTQAIAWQGLESMGGVWAATGHPGLAAQARTLATRLEKGLRKAIASSQKRLGDGSLFVPARLLDDERPYGTVTESHSGGYWNLVVPYAFASRLFRPGSAEANGVIRYLLLHGARLLGVVRAGAYSLYGLDASPPTSGVNPVYGLNVARLMADNDRADQLVLSLYGQLAITMTPGTFVAGEGISVTPLHDEYYRSTYLPPNGASNGTFLETLRLMLVHETRDASAAPRGLDLAFATPRPWLEAGKRIVVRNAPTSFGDVSFSIEAGKGEVRALVDAPARSRPSSLRLRLRLPNGSRISSTSLDGREYRRFDAQTGTIDLSGRTGRLRLVARLSGR